MAFPTGYQPLANSQAANPNLTVHDKTQQAFQEWTNLVAMNDLLQKGTASPIIFLS